MHEEKCLLDILEIYTEYLICLFSILFIKSSIHDFCALVFDFHWPMFKAGLGPWLLDKYDYITFQEV